MSLYEVDDEDFRKALLVVADEAETSRYGVQQQKQQEQKQLHHPPPSLGVTTPQKRVAVTRLSSPVENSNRPSPYVVLKAEVGSKALQFSPSTPSFHSNHRESRAPPGIIGRNLNQTTLIKNGEEVSRCPRTPDLMPNGFPNNGGGRIEDRYVKPNGLMNSGGEVISVGGRGGDVKQESFVKQIGVTMNGGAGASVAGRGADVKQESFVKQDGFMMNGGAGTSVAGRGADVKQESFVQQNGFMMNGGAGTSVAGRGANVKQESFVKSNGFINHGGAGASIGGRGVSVKQESVVKSNGCMNDGGAGVSVGGRGGHVKLESFAKSNGNMRNAGVGAIVEGRGGYVKQESFVKPNGYCSNEAAVTSIGGRGGDMRQQNFVKHESEGEGWGAILPLQEFQARVEPSLLMERPANRVWFQAEKTHSSREIVSCFSGTNSVLEFKQCQEAAMRTLLPSDYTMLQGKAFIKKTGWRKIAFCFNISFEIKDKTIQFDPQANVMRAEFVVRATMPSGRFTDSWGSCDRQEKRFNKPNHDIPSTAETRAKNRACQDLLGIGEYKSDGCQ